MRKGDEARIRFYDHAQDTTRLVTCTVYGRVLQVTKKKLVVESWICDGSRDTQNQNNTRFVIVRSAITEYKTFNR